MATAAAEWSLGLIRTSSGIKALADQRCEQRVDKVMAAPHDVLRPSGSVTTLIEVCGCGIATLPDAIPYSISQSFIRLDGRRLLVPNSLLQVPADDGHLGSGLAEPAPLFIHCIHAAYSIADVRVLSGFASITARGLALGLNSEIGLEKFNQVVSVAVTFRDQHIYKSSIHCDP